MPASVTKCTIVGWRRLNARVKASDCSLLSVDLLVSHSPDCGFIGPRRFDERYFNISIVEVFTSIFDVC